MLEGIEPRSIELTLSQFTTARENLRRAIERNGSGETAKVKRYG